MQVTNVRVSFLREKQPAQFEKSRPEVEFAAALDQGDDHLATARKLMTDAATIVYAGIGYAVPDRVAQALASGDVPAEVSVATETTEAAEAAPEAPEEAPEPEAKVKGRGRPKGSKNTRPKKGTKAAKEAEEAAAAAKEDDGIPGDDEPSAISTGEARIGPDDDPEDHGIPGEEETGDPTSNQDEADASVEATEFGPKELHTLIMSHVNATPRTLSVANAKQVLAHFKVARAQDLTDEQALEGKGMVEKMVAATAEQKES